MCALTSARVFAAATWCTRPCARSSRSLNILTAREPICLSSRRRLILLASYRMALTRERKNSSRIAREIEIFSILLGWSPRWSRSIMRGFEFSVAPSVDLDDQLTFMIHLVDRKSQFPCAILFLCLGPNLRTSLFVDPWLWINKLCTVEYISILKQNKSTLWASGEEISENGISTSESIIGKWKFTILQNGMVSYTLKIAFFHTSVWLAA